MAPFESHDAIPPLDHRGVPPGRLLGTVRDANLSGYVRIDVMKNPHAVALGKLGGLKGGVARARALSAERRRQIASAAGAARLGSLSPRERTRLARKAARARWALRAEIITASDAPVEVRRLLKSYDPAALRWADPTDRYEIVREILVRGDDEARRWLRRVLRRDEVRELIRLNRGAGCSEPQRAKLRRELRLTTNDIPIRPYLGFKWQSSQ